MKLALLKTKLIAADGLGPDYDQWDGYPAERSLLFELFRKLRGNIAVLSGDIHVSMAIELHEHPFDTNEQPVAVEFINTSLTSQNLDDKMKWGYRTESVKYEEGITEAFPHIKYCELDSHGYNLVDITGERIQVEYWHLETVLERSEKEKLGAVWQVDLGKPKLVRVK